MPNQNWTLLCQACGHRWTWEHELPIAATAWIARLKAQTICPACGNRSRAKAKRVVFVEATGNG